MLDRSRLGSTTTVHPTVRHQRGDDKCATEAKTAIRLPKEGTTIGTRNVRSLHACGKVQKLIHELKRNRWDTLALAGVQWTGFGETTMDAGHKIRYSGDDWKHQKVLTLSVQKEVVGSVIISTPVSSSLSPCGSLRDQTTSQSFRSMHQSQTTKMRRSNSSTSSLIASYQRLLRKIYL